MPARLAVCAFAAFLGLLFATEARAADGSLPSDGTAAADTVDSGGRTDETPPPPVEDSPTEPPAGQEPVDEAPAEGPAPEPAPIDETPPPEEPPAEESPSAGEAPASGPPPSESPVVEPPTAPEPPVVTPSPADPAGEEPPAEPTPVEVPSGDGSQRDSIVIIPADASPLRLPPLFPSPVGGLATGTGADDWLDPKGGSRSEAAGWGSQAAESTGDAPLLPALPFRDGAPSAPYVSAGGMGGGSSGGFFPLVLAGLVALFAAAAQRPGGVVPLTLAPPHCAAFVLCLERPD